MVVSCADVKEKMLLNRSDRQQANSSKALWHCIGRTTVHEWSPAERFVSGSALKIQCNKAACRCAVCSSFYRCFNSSRQEIPSPMKKYRCRCLTWKEVPVKPYSPIHPQNTHHTPASRQPSNRAQINRKYRPIPHGTCEYSYQKCNICAKCASQQIHRRYTMGGFGDGRDCDLRAAFQREQEQGASLACTFCTRRPCSSST